MTERVEKSATPVVTVISLAGLVVFWWMLALIKADPEVLPTPLDVAGIALGEAQSGELGFHVAATMLRVAAAFLLAMVVGCVLGVLLGLRPRLDRWADPWVVVFLNLPALVVIVLCYLWIGLNEVAAIAAVALNKTAMVLVTMREGVRTLDRSISDMARVYRLSRAQVLVHVWLPQLAPYLSTAARNGLAIIWKIVLVVEFLGRSNGVGFQVHLYFQLFETGYVLAYSLSFIALMLLIEYALVQPFERRTRAWRQPG